MAAGTTITATGAGTYTVPANVYSLKVELWGGAGGGGSVSGNGGAGGGGGAYCLGTIGVNPAGTYAYTVGTAAPVNLKGVAGQSNWGTTVLIALGGTSAGTITPGAGGAAGTKGYLNYKGGDGGTVNTSGDTGGGGGGAAGPDGAGLAGSAGIASGAGGAGGAGDNGSGGAGGGGGNAAAGTVGAANALGGGGGGGGDNTTAGGGGGYPAGAGGGGEGGAGTGSTGQIKITPNEAPTVALDTPLEAGTTSSLTPGLIFTGTDADSEEVEYEIQVDTANTFNSSGWDIASPSYVSSYNVAGSADTVSKLYIKGDGLKYYFTDWRDKLVYQYAMGTAWDITSSSFVATFDISPKVGGPDGLYISPDGKRMYVNDGATIYQYNLSTAWDVTTAAFTTGDQITVAEDAIPTCHTFSFDGRKMYLGGAANNFIYQYTVHVPWQIKSVVYASLSLDISGKEGSIQDIRFSDDGKTMFITGPDSDNVHQYTLSTAWDVSSASFSKSYSVSARENTPYTIFFKPDGKKMYVAGQQNNTFLQYNLSTAVCPVTAFSREDTGFTAGHPFASSEQVTYTVQSSLTEGTTYYWRVRAIDPLGGNAYGAWSPGSGTTGYQSFVAGTTAPVAPTYAGFKTLLGVGW